MADEPLIPFDFDPGSAEYETAHLEYGDDEAGKYVKWPLTGAHLSVLNHTNYPDLVKLGELNVEMFKNWDLFGYTVSDYHEFLCGILPAHAGYRLGSIEVTFGITTPLAVFLYDNFHNDHYFDEWENLSSARIIGCPREHAEALFVNAALQYQNQFDVLPEPMRIRVPEELEVDEHENKVQRFGPAIIDRDPLRFHYHGLAQLDNTAACIYYYRVLEYYAFFSSQRETSRLRHDLNLADVEFTKKILDLITRDEKGPILRLVGELADDGLLTLAHDQNLINVKDKGALGIRLYEFRNSIVHGKQSYGYILSSTPVIAPNDPTSKWREVLRRLAEKAIQSFGQKLI